MEEINESKIKSKIQEVRKEAQKASNKIQKVLDMLLKVEEKIKSILRDNGIKDSEVLEKFDYKGIKIRWAGSRHGRFLHLMVNGGIIPTNVEDLGRSFFYSGDLDAEYSYATAMDIKHLVNNLEGFLQNMKQKLQELQNIQVKNINI
ncbi:MAG: hypothetical protein QXO40_05130 [Candidatus Aenigmatarchaeota archaeon]